MARAASGAIYGVIAVMWSGASRIRGAPMPADVCFRTFVATNFSFFLFFWAFLALFCIFCTSTRKFGEGEIFRIDLYLFFLLLLFLNCLFFKQLKQLLEQLMSLLYWLWQRNLLLVQRQPSPLLSFERVLCCLVSRVITRVTGVSFYRPVYMISGYVSLPYINITWGSLQVNVTNLRTPCLQFSAFLFIRKRSPKFVIQQTRGRARTREGSLQRKHLAALPLSNWKKRRSIEIYENSSTHVLTRLRQDQREFIHEREALCIGNEPLLPKVSEWAEGAAGGREGWRLCAEYWRRPSCRRTACNGSYRRLPPHIQCAPDIY